MYGGGSGGAQLTYVSTANTIKNINVGSNNNVGGNIVNSANNNTNTNTNTNTNANINTNTNNSMNINLPTTNNNNLASSFIPHYNLQLSSPRLHTSTASSQSNGFMMTHTKAT